MHPIITQLERFFVKMKLMFLNRAADNDALTEFKAQSVESINFNDTENIYGEWLCQTNKNSGNNRCQNQKDNAEYKIWVAVESVHTHTHQRKNN